MTKAVISRCASPPLEGVEGGPPSLAYLAARSGTAPYNLAEWLGTVPYNLLPIACLFPSTIHFFSYRP